MKERCSYGLGKHPFPANYEVPSLKGQNEVPQECVHTPFYKECDVTPLVLR